MKWLADGKRGVIHVHVLALKHELMRDGAYLKGGSTIGELWF